MPYQCGVCSRAFMVKYLLRRHLVKHSDAGEMTCIVCRHASSDTTSSHHSPNDWIAATHEVSTENSKEDEDKPLQALLIACDESEAVDKDSIQVSTMKDKDDVACKSSMDVQKEVLFNCRFCDFVCSDMPVLSLHLKRIHNLQVYKCEICGFKASKKHLLRSHIKAAHPEVSVTVDVAADLQPPYKELFACKICDYRATIHSSLQLHMRVHNRAAVYPCPHCRRKFTVHSAFLRHVSRHDSEEKKALEAACLLASLPRIHSDQGQILS